MAQPAAIKAKWVGDLALQVLSHGRSGEVCGVFSAGLAFVFDGRVILVSADNRGWPFGIGLPDLPRLAKDWIGLPASSSPAALTLEAAGLTVDLRGVRVWDGRRALEALSPTLADASRAAERAHAYLAHHPRSDRGGHDPKIIPEFERRLTSALGRLTKGLQLRDRTTWAGAAESLLGLGPGLTPSGDDILVGLILVLLSCQVVSGAETRTFNDLIEFVEARASSRTTLYGASALHAAAMGECPEIIASSLQALYLDHSAVPHKLDELVSVGATSGHDTLVGIAAGLDVLAPPRR